VGFLLRRTMQQFASPPANTGGGACGFQTRMAVSIPLTIGELETALGQSRGIETLGEGAAMRLFRVLVIGVMAGLVCTAQAQQPPEIVRENAKLTPAEDGAAMFGTYCAVCHGTTGKGNGPAAAALKRQPADLTQLNQRNNGSFPAIKVGLIIKGDEVMASHGSRDMPIWGKIFTDMEGERLASLRIHNLTEFVRTLQQK